MQPSRSPVKEARLCLMLPRLGRGGGVEGFAWRLAEALAAQGHRVDFVCSRQEGKAPPGVRPVVIGRRGLTRAGKMLWFAWAAERVRAEGGYDLCMGLGRTLRQDLLRYSGGTFPSFHRLTLPAFRPGLPRLAKRLTRALGPANVCIRALEKRQLAAAPLLVVVSHKTLEWMARDYPWLDTATVRVVYNRPDLARFAPLPAQERERARARFGLGPDQVMLATGGTSFARKGLDTCIRALPELPEACVLAVAGARGASRYRRLARRLGIASRVRFLGGLEPEDMGGFYNAAHCFVLPSLFDTCSNAVLEAMACGTRVVGSSRDGSSFFLPPERVLADPADPAELARAVRAALAAPRPEPFTWPEHVPSGVEPYLELINGLLAERARDSRPPSA
jgi:UDP-glucose:(heptosyl)LPS alpha-1,3-glucosyltransferase